MKNVLRNIFYLFFPLLIGSIIGGITSNAIDYSNLAKPPFSPPSILFPIVWSIIYLLMGIAYYLFQRNVYRNKKVESFIYYLQLFINALWSIIFFVFKWRLFSVFWIVLLFIFVLINTIQFSKKYKPSAYLFIPYLLWLAYATYLNIGIYLLN